MRIGVHLSTREGCSFEEAMARIDRAERAGWDAIWVGQVWDYEALGLLAAAGRRTRHISLGTWVVPSHPRHPLTLAQQALTAQAASGGRLILAVGVSHRVIIESKLGLDYSRPARHMREYLNLLAPLLRGEQVDHEGIELRVHARLTVAGAARPLLLLAALGPRMLEIAGRQTDGTAIWLGGPRYLRDFALPRIRRAAEAAGRPPPRIACGFPVAVCADRSAARAAARSFLAPSARLPAYRAVLERNGDPDPASVAIVGDAAEVRGQLRALADLGITDLNAVLFPIDADPAALARTSELLASLARDGL